MPFLPEAIESLLHQTVSNFTILVIVDGSDDGSLQYLETVRDARLRVLIQPRCGLTATLNRLLLETKTSWLVRQDADDISYPTRIERIQEHISQYPAAALFYSLAEYYPPKRSMGLFRCSRGSPQELRQIVQSGYLLSICHPSVALHVDKTLALGGTVTCRMRKTQTSGGAWHSTMTSIYYPRFSSASARMLPVSARGILTFKSYTDSTFNTCYCHTYPSGNRCHSPT